MREIKFKVWDNEYQEFSNWTNRDPYFCISSGKIFFWERVRRDDGSYGGDIVLEDLGDRFVLLQHTGVKDKNNKEIYEGDILKILNHFQLEQVEYEPFGSGFGFFIYDSEKRDSGSFEFISHWTGSDGYEIVGNIFENPELLKL